MAIDNLDLKKSINDEKKLKRNYLTKGFEQFREELLNHARNYFPTKINDFSEASLGGMLLDFAAIVGDSLSFYMDHQYNELDPSTAVENENIIKHIKNAGIKVSPASPAVVKVVVKVEVDLNDTGDGPNPNQLPKILKNLKLSSLNNISFYLLHDVDFTDGSYEIERTTNTTVVIKKYGLAISGNRTTETFSFDNTYRQFPNIFLSNSNITMIENVVDTNDNIYYEVEYLSQDTIYKATKINKQGDKYYEIVPAPYRFVREDNFDTGQTSIRFGTSNQDSFMEKSLIQDPTKSAVSLYGRDYFPKFSFDPGDLLKTNSLGIAPRNTVVYVTYSYGGGLNHNIPSYNINKIDDNRNIIFKQELTDQLKREIILNSVFITNEEPAKGGRSALNFNELKAQIPNAMKMQNRIVNYQDLLGKIYSMPSPFGKVSKIALEDDANNIYSKNIYVLCEDISKKLTYASDVLKQNLMQYLNEYRLIGDSFTILDAKIFNITINVNIRMDLKNSSITVDQVERNVKNNLIFYFKGFEINQPIELDSIYNVVLNTYGVGSVVSKKHELISQKRGRYSAPAQLRSSYPSGFQYSNDIINIQQQIYKDILYPTKGGIFEIKYPVVDIVAKVVSS